MKSQNCITLSSYTSRLTEQLEQYGHLRTAETYVAATRSLINFITEGASPACIMNSNIICKWHEIINRSRVAFPN